MERLAKTILLAAKIREESFNKEMGAELEKGCAARGFVPDYTPCYAVSLMESCDRAASGMGYDLQGTKPVYLLLRNSWDDSLAWAKTVVN